MPLLALLYATAVYLFFLATFALTSNFVLSIGTIFGERLLYLPSAGASPETETLARERGRVLERVAEQVCERACEQVGICGDGQIGGHAIASLPAAAHDGFDGITGID